MHQSSQIHSIVQSYEKCLVNLYTRGTRLLNFSLVVETAKNNLLVTPLTIEGLLGLGLFLIDGQHKTAIAYSVQNKCRLSSTKSIKHILKFAREWWKSLISSSHVFLPCMDARVWLHTWVISTETQGAQS